MIEEKKKKKRRRSRLDAKKECQFLSNILLFVYCLGRGRIEFNKILCQWFVFLQREKLEAAVAVEKKKKKKGGETCRTIEGVISSALTLNDVSYPRLCQW